MGVVNDIETAASPIDSTTSSVVHAVFYVKSATHSSLIDEMQSISEVTSFNEVLSLNENDTFLNAMLQQLPDQSSTIKLTILRKIIESLESSDSATAETADIDTLTLEPLIIIEEAPAEAANEMATEIVDETEATAREMNTEKDGPTKKRKRVCESYENLIPFKLELRRLQAKILLLWITGVEPQKGTKILADVKCYLDAMKFREYMRLFDADEVDLSVLKSWLTAAAFKDLLQFKKDHFYESWICPKCHLELSKAQVKQKGIEICYKCLFWFHKKCMGAPVVNYDYTFCSACALH